MKPVIVMAHGVGSSSRLTSLLSEVREYLAKHQPELKAKRRKHNIHVHGTLSLSYKGSSVDQYNICILISDKFPEEMPKVYEVGGRISESDYTDRHVNPGRDCCLCVPEEWQIRTDLSVKSFFEGPLKSFFVSQSKFERDGLWPFGEWEHGNKGILQGYGEMLGLFGDTPDKVIKTLEHLQKPHQSQVDLCLCGSKRKVIGCHGLELAELRKRIPPERANKMLEIALPAIISTQLTHGFPTHGSIGVYKQPPTNEAYKEDNRKYLPGTIRNLVPRP